MLASAIAIVRGNVKAVLMLIGMAALAAGLLFIGQGLGYVPWPASSFMIDQIEWAYYEGVLAFASLCSSASGDANLSIRIARSRQQSTTSVLTETGYWVRAGSAGIRAASRRKASRDTQDLAQTCASRTQIGAPICRGV
jgi:hypothetical protein